MHDLLIAKLQAYGFYKDFICNYSICNYLVNREQRVKINSSFSKWSKIYVKNMVYPRDPYWGLDMFFDQKDANFAAHADDNTPYFCDKNLEVLLSKLQICAPKPFDWFSNNHMKMNSDKCHLTLSANDENKKIELNGELINNTQVQLLGVHIDYKLKFDTHIKSQVA